MSLYEGVVLQLTPVSRNFSYRFFVATVDFLFTGLCDKDTTLTLTLTYLLLSILGTPCFNQDC